MAYSKLVTCGPDYAIGHQTVNQARDNFDAQYTAWLAHHGEKEFLAWPGSKALPPIDALGHHNDERIPRDSIKVTNRTAGVFIAIDQTTSRCIGQGLRTAAGLYTFPITGLSQAWGIVATPGTGSPRVAFCNTVSSGGGLYLQVQTCDGTSSTLAGIDTDFVLTVYGNR